MQPVGPYLLTREAYLKEGRRAHTPLSSHSPYAAPRRFSPGGLSFGGSADRRANELMRVRMHIYLSECHVCTLRYDTGSFASSSAAVSAGRRWPCLTHP